MFKLLERLLNPFPPDGGAQPPQSLYRFFLYHTRDSRAIFVILAATSAGIALAEVVLFSQMGKLIDVLNTSNTTAFWHEIGLQLKLGIALLLVGIPLLVLVRSAILFQCLTGNFAMAIGWRTHRHLLKQSVQYFNNEMSGRISTKLMQTSDSLRDSMIKLLDAIVYIGIYFISIIYLMMALDYRLSIPMILWVILYFAVLLFFLPKVGKLAIRQADARSEMIGRFVDTYTNITTVKLFSNSKRERSFVQAGMTGFLESLHPQMRLITVLNVLLWSLNSLLIFSLAAVSVWLWSDSLITTGAIGAALALALRLNGMSLWIMAEIGTLFQNIGIVKDGMHTLSRPCNIVDRKDARPLVVTRGEIHFRNIHFHYGNGKGVIENFHLRIQPREKIGLIGQSGSGKSTLLNLLIRFYDTESGSIEIDGQDVRSVSQESLRENISMVSQDVYLMHRSIRENLLYAKPDASDEAIIEALKKSQAFHFVTELIDEEGRRGLDALIGERGVKLSGGQRQRLAIARALLKDSPILILDEATSALDSTAEAEIQASLSQLMQNKTVIAVAHRLSTISSMDRLIVLDRGRIREEGKHSALLKNNGLYAEFWNKQSGGFIGE